MSDEIRPISLLYMWLLVTRGGEALLRDIRPECKREYRRPLIARGLIEETPAGRTKKLSLTDAGWHYLATHMTDPVNTMSAATTANVLQGVLAAMDRHMRSTDATFAEVFATPVAADAAEKASVVREPIREGDDELWARLSQAWSGLQEADMGIRLDKLRPAFADVSRERLDRALLDWLKQDKIVIYPYDDGERVTPEVKAAALKAAGRDLHLIYKK